MRRNRRIATDTFTTTHVSSPSSTCSCGGPIYEFLPAGPRDYEHPLRHVEKQVEFAAGVSNGDGGVIGVTIVDLLFRRINGPSEYAPRALLDINADQLFDFIFAHGHDSAFMREDLSVMRKVAPSSYVKSLLKELEDMANAKCGAAQCGQGETERCAKFRGHPISLALYMFKALNGPHGTLSKLCDPQFSNELLNRLSREGARRVVERCTGETYDPLINLYDVVSLESEEMFTRIPMRDQKRIDDINRVRMYVRTQDPAHLEMLTDYDEDPDEILREASDRRAAKGLAAQFVFCQLARAWVPLELYMARLQEDSSENKPKRKAQVSRRGRHSKRKKFNDAKTELVMKDSPTFSADSGSSKSVVSFSSSIATDAEAAMETYAKTCVSNPMKEGVNAITLIALPCFEEIYNLASSAEEGSVQFAATGGVPLRVLKVTKEQIKGGLEWARQVGRSHCPRESALVSEDGSRTSVKRLAPPCRFVPGCLSLMSQFKRGAAPVRLVFGTRADFLLYANVKHHRFQQFTRLEALLIYIYARLGGGEEANRRYAGVCVAG